MVQLSTAGLGLMGKQHLDAINNNPNRGVAQITDNVEKQYK